MAGNALIISDLQMPYENAKALAFCTYLKRHFSVADDDVYNVGDEADELHGGNYPKDPDGDHTANSEIKATRAKFQEWAAVFPVMKLAVSNHGMRWAKKASLAEIPSQMIQAYQKVLNAPEGWRWQDSWTVKGTKQDFLVKHGLDCGGKTPYRNAAEIGALSVAFGHLHSTAGLCHVKTNDKNIWAMNVGCLIDPESYAFKYEKYNKFKPNLGCGVVLDGGRLPIWIPL